MDIIKEKGVHTQLIKNVRYVYIDKPYWDKIKKQNRHSREYIGKLGKDGEFIPNKNYLRHQEEAENKEVSAKEFQIADRKFYGAIHLLNFIAEKTGLEINLKQIFGIEKANKLLSLAYFLVSDGESSMYRYKKFAKTHVTPYGEPITSQRISEVFASISENEKMNI